MNHTMVALVAVLAAAALVVGTFASPAFADSSKTNTKQVNKLKEVLSGFVTIGIENACNSIKIVSTSNSLQC
jgi:hypothetical protein